jgi:hypothetical protein
LVLKDAEERVQGDGRVEVIRHRAEVRGGKQRFVVDRVSAAGAADAADALILPRRVLALYRAFTRRRAVVAAPDAAHALHGQQPLAVEFLFVVAVRVRIERAEDAQRPDGRSSVS